MTPLRPDHEVVRLHMRRLKARSESVRETLSALLHPRCGPDATVQGLQVLLRELVELDCAARETALAFELPLERAQRLRGDDEAIKALVPPIIEGSHQP